MMSDYNNDFMRRDEPYDLNARRGSNAWGWIAGAVLVAILVGLAFGVGHTPNQSGNQMAQNTPMTQPAPAPSGPASTTFAPGAMNHATPAPANPAQPQPKP
jgi:cell division protein FtsN